MDVIPRLVTVAVGKGASVDGLIIDFVHKGGLVTEAAGQESAWKNLTYDSHCEGPPKELLQISPIKKGGYW